MNPVYSTHGLRFMQWRITLFPVKSPARLQQSPVNHWKVWRSFFYWTGILPLLQTSECKSSFWQRDTIIPLSTHLFSTFLLFTCFRILFLRSTSSGEEMFWCQSSSGSSPSMSTLYRYWSTFISAAWTVLLVTARSWKQYSVFSFG